MAHPVSERLFVLGGHLNLKDQWSGLMICHVQMAINTLCTSADAVAASALQECNFALQDATLRPSLSDIDEQLAQLVAEQGALNASLAEKREQDQALLSQMLPPQVSLPHNPSH